MLNRPSQLPDSYQDGPSVACIEAFRIVGDMPTLAIIYILSSGSKRFGELEKLTHINPGTLTNRLKHIHELQIIERFEHKDDNQSVSYSLTKLGKKLLPIIRQVDKFSEELTIN
jgi:DNA-binding HxlR family transcriptional regulator